MPELSAVSTSMPQPASMSEPAGPALTAAAAPPQPPPTSEAAVPSDADLSYLGIGANADYVA